MLGSVADLAAEYVEALARLDPCRAVLMGLTSRPSGLTGYGPQGHAARADLARDYLQALSDCPASGEDDRVTAQVMQRRLSVELELCDRGFRQAQLDFVDAPVTGLQRVFSQLDTSSAGAWSDVERLLTGVPQALRSYADSLREGVRQGEVAASRQVLACAQRCDSTAPRFLRLVDPYGSGPLRQDLDAAADTAAGAYETFGRFLRDELAPVAPQDDARGGDRYLVWARFHLGTSIDPAEVYGWACEEFASLRSQMTGLALGISGSRNLADAMRRLDADPGQHIPPGDPARRWMNHRVQRAFEAVEPHFDIPAPLYDLGCELTDEGGIYYSRPSQDFLRPGRIWFSLPADQPLIAWRAATTLVHEGVPGHHLQLGHTVWLGDHLDDFRRLACHVPGHAEGWALYAEQLMDELDALESDHERLGMLDAQLLRTARVIVDLGMHLKLRIPNGFGFHDGQTWTPALAHKLLAEHLVNPWADFVAYEIDRYLGRPGQALAYKIGQREWLKARESALTVNGRSDAQLRAFHRRALNLGNIDLDTLQEAFQPPTGPKTFVSPVGTN